MSSQNDNTRLSAIVILVLSVTLFAVMWNPVRWADAAYPHNYHGSITSWFALMSENMAEQGFTETRLLPAIHPNPDPGENRQLYITHPVLDVVGRAGLIRVLGNSEWVIRLQGLLGILGAAVFMVWSIKREIPLACCLLAGLLLVSMPIAQKLTNLSGYHPQTLFFSLAAFCLYKSSPLPMKPMKLGILLLLLFLGMNTDWPGYFMPALIWSLEILRKKESRRPLLIALPCLCLASFALFLFHVQEIGNKDLTTAFSAATTSTLAPASFIDSIVRIFGDQLTGYGIPGLALFVFALFLVIGVKEAAKHRSLFFAFFLYGAANYIVFARKAPGEDFWGCYWLPLIGFSGGLVADWCLRRTARPRAVILGGCLIAGLSAWSVPWDAAAFSSGETHKKEAGQLLQAIPAEDRGIFITNRKDRELKVLMAYTRVSLLYLDPLPEEVANLKDYVLESTPVLPRGKILFICDSTRPEIQAEFKKRAPNYKGIPLIFDVSDLLNSGQ